MVILGEVLAVTVPAAMALMAGTAPYEWSLPAALFACIALPLRHRRPWLSLLACLPALLGGLGWPATVVALYHIGRTSGVRSMAAWVAVTTLTPATLVVINESLPPSRTLLTYAFTLFVSGAPTALGALITTRQELTTTLAEAQRARAAELAAREHSARAAERARIAREIHDAVGHHATLIAVESAALAATTDEPETRVAALRLRTSAKEALNEMRAALALLHAEPPRNQDGIPTLVERARAAGVKVTLDDQSGPIPPAVGRAAFRVVQEALTNVTKHAPGAEVHVRLSQRDGTLRISVVNGPPTAAAAEPKGDGIGLHGLAERVRLAGGTLRCGPSGDGFAVEATLPISSSEDGEEGAGSRGARRGQASA
ncbi:hypothetical protein GCM10010185_52670 [Saccharothrix coeruleofusca]|uniref:histidine kinase n=1 Tax=Saccharothrix coeruleofusca TaxID=33919 RepID=A0A918ARI0_9PSEU|nr:hypothetical protein GCM10010185_52670 [Saccharothrix coeruleofusca]